MEPSRAKPAGLTLPALIYVSLATSRLLEQAIYMLCMSSTTTMIVITVDVALAPFDFDLRCKYETCVLRCHRAETSALSRPFELFCG